MQIITSLAEQFPNRHHSECEANGDCLFEAVSKCYKDNLCPAELRAVSMVCMRLSRDEPLIDGCDLTVRTVGGHMEDWDEYVWRLLFNSYPDEEVIMLVATGLLRHIYIQRFGVTPGQPTVFDTSTTFDLGRPGPPWVPGAANERVLVLIHNREHFDAMPLIAQGPETSNGAAGTNREYIIDHRNKDIRPLIKPATWPAAQPVGLYHLPSQGRDRAAYVLMVCTAVCVRVRVCV